MKSSVLKVVINVFLLNLTLAMVGCAPSNPYQAGSFERAKFYADNGKDIEAVAAFESFVRHSPTDSLAAEAQYLRAKTYLNMQEYPLAAVEFQIMRKDYPTSPFVENALFGEGESYLFQVGRVERDLTGALEARSHFLNFSQTYPSSEYMPQVSDYLAEISDLVVKKRLEQVRVYGQLKRYSAIAIVLDDVMVKEAGSSLMPRVMWERAEVAIRLDDPDTAAEMYEGILNRFSDGDYAASAATELRKLDEEDEDF